MKLRKKIKKYFEYGYTKLKLFFRQKKYANGNISLKYLFDRNKKSKTLVVVFSACTREGVKARYNYVRTLKKVKTNKLFILDDFAEDKRGGYYLGQYPEFLVEKTVEKLILTFYERYGAEKLILCGSSKGGWASLDFGFSLNLPNKVIVCGAPQYLLGNYLCHFPITFSFIKGNATAEEVVEELNVHAKRRMEWACLLPKIYLHYSVNEHTYNDHIADLLNDLTNMGISFSEDRATYTSHSDVSYHFPEYLLESIRAEL